LAAVNGAWASDVSPLNLSPGFPTQVDDAYPINKGAIVLQPAIRADKTKDGNARLLQTVDIRMGLASGLEVTVGATPLHGQLNPGSVDDPRAVRVGLLYRFLYQPYSGSPSPSVAIRTTAEVPYGGLASEPALRSELVLSWDLTEGWWWHMNLEYEVAPGFQPGLLSPGRTSVWKARGGLVRALAPNTGAVMSLAYGQDSTQLGSTVFTPEVGLMHRFMDDWIVMVGGGHDFGASTQKAALRANLSLSWIW
jgi:hypothetical protein